MDDLATYAPWIVATIAVLGWWRERQRDTKAEIRDAVNAVIGENLLQHYEVADRARKVLAEYDRAIQDIATVRTQLADSSEALQRELDERLEAMRIETDKALEELAKEMHRLADEAPERVMNSMVPGMSLNTGI